MHMKGHFIKQKSSQYSIMNKRIYCDTMYTNTILSRQHYSYIHLSCKNTCTLHQGRLPHDQDIAVKRLSPNSVQGFREFMNEIKLIASLQHKNLVRLLGCCIKGKERILVYEFLPSGSLEEFIFGTFTFPQEKQKITPFYFHAKITEGRNIFYFFILVKKILSLCSHLKF